ncbi:MAG: CdaR family protein [Thermoanaerobaculia bacterium]
MSNGAQSIWGLRILALVVAVVLWFTVSEREREPRVDRSLQIPIAYAVPEGYLLLEPTASATVRLRGPASSINQLRPEDIQVLVEVAASTTPDGTVELTLQPEEHVEGLSTDLQVLELEPRQLQLTLDREVTRDVVVHPRITGEPAAGATVAGHAVTPPEVTVRGPASHLPQAFSLSTTPIPLDERQGSFEETVAAVSTDPLVQIVRPRVVKVTVRLRTPDDEASE